MIRSLRLRLQLWYAVVLLAAIGTFAGLLYYRERRARLQEIDSQLEAAAQYLDASLRRFPPPELTGRRPLGPPRPRGLRHPPDRERLLVELTTPEVRSWPGSWEAPLYFIVWRGDGVVLKTSDPPPQDLIPAEPPHGPLARLSSRAGNREATVRGPHESIVVVGRSLSRVQANLRKFAWQLTGAGAVVLGLGMVGGWLVASRVLRPIAAITATAAGISAANLSERIPTEAIDSELRDLANVLNATFSRLEAAFARQVQFTADASHELRTPLAILRTQAELALSRDRTAPEYREALQACCRAARRMTTLIDTLLLLARADAGRVQMSLGPVDLAGVIEDCVDLLQPLALTRDISVVSRLDTIEVEGDASRLGQVVTNLLNNAILYNHPGGKVELTLARSGKAALLGLADTGCGIPEEELPNLFERFHRVDRSRSRGSGGNGLGLAICKNIVEAHGGRIWAESRLGEGSTFWVEVPITPPAKNGA